MANPEIAPLPDHYTWLIPVDTRPSQCLHVCIKPTDPEKRDVNVVVSDYECLYGHRASHLMAKMVSGAETSYHIDIEEPPRCDVLKALEFMHADVPTLDLDSCSALVYANTAHFLDIRRLADEVISCASSVIRAVTVPRGTESNSGADTDAEDMTTDSMETTLLSNASEGSTTSSSPQNDRTSTSTSTSTSSSTSGGRYPLLSPWDAVAALTLLGDPSQALALVDLKQWFQRDPRLFEHPDLFNSCHFFGPQKFGNIIKMMNEHHSMEQYKLKARCAQRVLGYGIVASSLQADLRAVLHSYVGKHVIAAHRSSGSSSSSPLSSSTGTVVNSFIEKEKAYVVVEWHLCASKSVIRLRDFVMNGQYRVLDSRGAAASARHSSQGGHGHRRPPSAELKSRGAMKYT